MNIFMMILVAVFMVGFYMISSPSQRVPEQETEYAVNMSDLRAVAECASAVHNAQIRDTEFQDICIEQNNISSARVCLGSNMRITECDGVRNRLPEYYYIITATGPLNDTNYNNMLDILETDFPDAGTFGIYMDGKIMLGGLANAQSVPESIITELGLENGQLVYMTQYEPPAEITATVATPDAANDIICPVGTIKTYRFGRWQCIGLNLQTDCGGDMIWDSELQACVADDAKKPLCAEQQTAVLVDSVWECVNPFPETVCPSGTIARLNYSTLEWECVDDPSATDSVKKCENVIIGASFGAVGTTAGISRTSCTDCEKMIVNPDTCVSVCVPDPTQINNPACYTTAQSECSGPSRAFYFGFPSQSYANNVSAVAGNRIPMDAQHSQNRMFNCLDCGDGEIDSEKSLPPYIAVCK